MAKDYLIENSSNIAGKAIGMGWIRRLSTADIRTAQPIDWHTHDGTEIICCLRGNLEYDVRSRKSIVLPAGSYIVIPKDLRHRISAGIDAPSLRFTLLLGNVLPRKPGFGIFSRAEYGRMLSSLLGAKLRPYTFPPNMRPLLARIPELIRREDGLTGPETLELRALTLSALITFVRGISEPPAEGSKMISEALRWLDGHYAEKVTLDQLVAFMGYSRSRLEALFSAHTGLPPMEWLIRRRIEHAKKLLTTTDLPVHEIASRVGFTDAAFFSRSFLKRVGASPLKYAQSVRPRRLKR